LYAVEFEEPEPRCGFFHDVKSSKWFLGLKLNELIKKN
jgi:hypothetical protein